MVKSKRGSGSSTSSGQLTTRLPFPLKLYEMLEDADEQGFNDIVSWNKDGNGFMVHDTTNFVLKIIPSYYNCTKYKSFQRQLSLYGFTRVATGDNKGLRGHKNFIRGCKDLCRQMKPVASGGGTGAGGASSSSSSSSGIPMTSSCRKAGQHGSQESKGTTANTVSNPQSPNSIVPTTATWKALEAIPAIPTSIDYSIPTTAPCPPPPRHQPMIPPAPLVPAGVETREPSSTTSTQYTYVPSTSASGGTDRVAIIPTTGTHHHYQPPPSSAVDYRPTTTPTQHPTYHGTVHNQVSFNSGEEGDVGFFEGMPFFLTERKHLSGLLPSTTPTTSVPPDASTSYLGPRPVLPSYPSTSDTTTSLVHSIVDDNTATISSSTTHTVIAPGPSPARGPPLLPAPTPAYSTTMYSATPVAATSNW